MTTSSSLGLTCGTGTTWTPWQKAGVGPGTKKQNPVGGLGEADGLQHQCGRLVDEWTPASRRHLREPDHREVVEAVLGLREAAWGHLIETGLIQTPLRGTSPRHTGGGRSVWEWESMHQDSRSDQAVCTSEIVRRSVLASYRAGAHGVIFGPATSGNEPYDPSMAEPKPSKSLASSRPRHPDPAALSPQRQASRRS